MTAPWTLFKTDEGKERLKTVMYVLCECLRFIGVLIAPAMPQNAREDVRAAGDYGRSAANACIRLRHFGQIQPGTKVEKGEALFPRIDVEQELKDIVPEPKAAVKRKGAQGSRKPEITIDDFAKVQLCVARVLAAEKVEKSDKLLKLTPVAWRRASRSAPCSAASRKFYTPEAMVGKQVVLVKNLKPVKIRGILSEGMILCASDKDDKVLQIVSPERGRGGRRHRPMIDSHCHLEDEPLCRRGGTGARPHAGGGRGPLHPGGQRS